MDRKTAKALRNYAKATKQPQKVVKRDWLKLNHQERGHMRRVGLGVKK